LVVDEPVTRETHHPILAVDPAPEITGSGGGIYAVNARVTIQQSTVAANSALKNASNALAATRAWGGGVYASGCILETRGTTFLGNDALATDGSGGAIKLLESQARMRDGEVSDNQAGQPNRPDSGSGGGVDILSGTMTLSNIALRRNAAANGSAVFLRPSSVPSAASALTLTNVLIAGHQGSALALLPNASGRSHAEVRHTTLISNNVAVLAGANQSIHITNSLIAGNITAAQALDGGAIALDHTDRYNNNRPAEGNVSIGPAGNLSLPPGFVPGDLRFRLASGSPLLDQGVALADVANDFEGQPRSSDGNGDGVALPDLGWDELTRSAAMFGPDPTLFAPPGQLLLATLDLRNVGVAGDSFQIGIATPGAWSATAQPSLVALGPGAQTRLKVRIAVPVGAPSNSQAVLVVRAVGQTSAATARIVVVVRKP
jgi:hypothetical protein